MSVWDTPEDLMRYGKQTLSRLRREHKIKPDKGPYITEASVVQRLSDSQLTLDQHRHASHHI